MAIGASVPYVDARERVTGSLDYARPGIVFAHETWKQNDGSKAGLLKLIKASKKTF